VWSRDEKTKWVTDVRDQAAADSVTFHFKQWGESRPGEGSMERLAGKNWRGGSWMAGHGTRSRFRRPDVTLSAKTFYPTTPFSSRDSTVKNRFKQEIFAGRSLV